ncbi:hypothetical protein MYSTI_04703 [Myxococcus stipitatus DSM 14675]|uniref:Lipoprotein n=1 Tax=Myxococcus stipitatus (strain DSM 14675 / JCM 12634 / Mx s8) TaxID=1278073 RepID=L7UDS6_MYXSD|nr:hypothetical protein [Myxococcus stipitatus]AGC45995.1 hypothetical protein MYSTI_04703 [Myxococcus stipitatus DSM 14675]
MFKRSAKLSCVVALVLSGCGGAPQEPSPTEASEVIESSEQSLLWACGSTRSFNRYWYVNNIEVGREYCDCDGTLNEFGTLSGRYTQVLISYCR